MVFFSYNIVRDCFVFPHFDPCLNTMFVVGDGRRGTEIY